MRDHDTARRRGAVRKVVGVRELKTHAAGILRHVRDARASYILTHRGRAVGMILPIEPADDSETAADDAAAWDVFVQAGRRLERRFRPGISGVRELSAMRR